ncbi:MAG: carbamoyltransferase HypF, partial [candidate division WOR-3 bacterium]|nr:carbamoyltransferase HypF [candidate division WOR-3 bacterium]
IGQVQGIGFRPFIYRVAKKLNLRGYVRNSKSGVQIKIQGGKWKNLIDILHKKPPSLAKIDQIKITKHLDKSYQDFTILKSLTDNQTNTAEIPPDLAVCEDCTRDFLNPKNRRYFYPFTNCTQCGPRYSIIYNLPYDRGNTTMSKFKMCSLCYSEYRNPLDRRFHAQPNACSVCGPHLLLYKIGNRPKAKKNCRIFYQQDNYSQRTLRTAQQLLAKGAILAIKSIGGFLLACDAQNDDAVNKLRRRKHRPQKPFAVMCKDIKTIRRLCYVSAEEIQLLKSKTAPIVLLKKKPNANMFLSDKVAPKNGYLGVMLPYTPLHQLLFHQIKTNSKNVSRETSNKTRKNTLDLTALIMTSANPPNEPIISRSEGIEQKLNKVVDYILDNNRGIESRCDDSVVFNFNGPVIIRRSRGYVPEPIILKNINLKPVLAFGADLKCHFAIAQGNKVFYGPYIGDLSSKASVDFLMEMTDKYQKWFNVSPEVVVCDLHPDYISTRIAEQYAKKHKLQLIKVQHHFAHLAGVMAENSLSGITIGVSFDGTGYGTDGNVWGGEIFVLDYKGFQRVAHLEYMPLIAGDVLITTPKLLAKTYLNESTQSNGTMTSSMGRLFDAVASVLDVCHYQTFEGEAPIRLEAEAMKVNKYLPVQQFQASDSNGEIIFLKPSETLKHMINLKKNYSVPVLARHFHNIIINTTVSTIKQLSGKYKTKNVCLSGGVFQNKIILKGIYTKLRKYGYNVYINRKVPINDGGIAFGQSVIAGVH